jgi:hypothetical protein
MQKKYLYLVGLIGLVGIATYVFTNTDLLKGALPGTETLETEGADGGGTDSGGIDGETPTDDGFGGGGKYLPGPGGFGGGFGGGGTETPSDDGDGTAYIFVQDEFGNEIDDLTVADFDVSGGSDNTIVDFDNRGSGSYVLTLYTGDTYDITVSEGGFVSYTISDMEPNTDSDDVIEIETASLEYGYKVKMWDGSNTWASSDVFAGDLTTECEVKYDTSGSSDIAVYGCLVPLAETEYKYYAEATGYETMSGTFDSDRTSASDASQTVNIYLVIPEGVDTSSYTDQFVTVYDDFGNTITGLSESDFSVTNEEGNGIHDFEDTGNGIYRIELKVTNNNDYTLTVEPDGYVSSTTELEDNLPDYEASTLHDFARYILPKNEDGDAVEGASVTTAGVTCEEESTGGAYGCVVPLSETDLTYTVTADGYDDYEGSFDGSRTSHSDSSLVARLELTTTAVEEDDLDKSTDTDGDGLTDSEEDLYGTDPADADTDGDGLNDYEEVMTYETDPLDTDSDGGSVSDYDEVQNGTDPNDSSDDVEEDVATDDTEVTADDDEETVLTDKAKKECTDVFKDTVGNFAQDAICYLYQIGAAEGRRYGYYEPDDNVTKAEFLKLALLTNSFEVDEGLDVTKYSDVGPGDWFYYYVALADSMKDLWFSGDGIWSPNSDITRGDAILLLVRLSNKTLYGIVASDVTFDDVPLDSYQTYAIVLGEQYGVIEGYEGTDEYRPDNKITRAEAAIMVIRSKALFK